MSDKIHLLDTGKKNDLKASVDSLKRELPELIEHMQTVAKIRRASYLALVEEGFTSEQALELCKRSEL